MVELNVCGIPFSQMTDEALETVIKAAEREKKERRVARANELWHKLNDVFNEINEAGYRVTTGWDTIIADDLAVEDVNEDE